MTKNFYKSYARILIINGDPFNKKTATGITLCNIFSGWDKDKIAVIYNRPIEPDTDICSKYWYITKSNFPVITVVRKFKNLIQKFFSNKTIALSEKITVRKDNVVFIDSQNEVLGAWADMATLRIQKQLWNWLEDFKPDVIYSNLSNIRIMNLVLKISERYSLPIVPHFMDDWPTTCYTSSRWIKIPRWQLLSRLRRVLLVSPVRLSISEAMSLEFTARYGPHFEAFMNCVDFSSLSECPNREEFECIRFAYIGGLHLNRWQALKDIAVSMQKIHSEGVNIELVVYAPSYDLEIYGLFLSEIPVVKIGGSLRSDDVNDYLQKFDVLIHIESFDEFDRLYTKFSISTKIPQYMASGKPIFAYGPDEVASCRYIKDNDCGAIVGEKNSDILTNVIRKLTLDKQLRDRFGKNGRMVAFKKHNAEFERERFRILFREFISYD